MGHSDSSAALSGAGAFRAAAGGTCAPASRHRSKGLSVPGRVLLMAIRVYQTFFSALLPAPANSILPVPGMPQLPCNFTERGTVPGLPLSVLRVATRSLAAALIWFRKSKNIRAARMPALILRDPRTPGIHLPATLAVRQDPRAIRERA